MALAPDDPAREKIKELKEKNATSEEIMDAMSTFEVSASYLIKALSPGHAKVMVAELLEHMIQTHVTPGAFALSSVREPEAIDWLDGPLFGGPELDG
jgi:hypothetical protein